MKRLRFFYSETNPEVNYQKHVVPERKRKKFPKICIASAYDPISMTLGFGMSSCCYKDQYDKAAGRDMAAQRAVSEPIVEVICTEPKMLHYISSAVAQELMLYKIDKSLAKI